MRENIHRACVWSVLTAVSKCGSAEVIRYKVRRTTVQQERARSIIKFHLALPYPNVSSLFIGLRDCVQRKRTKIPVRKTRGNSKMQTQETILFVVHANTLLRNNIFAIVFPACANSTYVGNTRACLATRLHKSHLNKMVLMQAICLWRRAFILLVVQFLRDPVSQSKSS